MNNIEIVFSLLHNKQIEISSNHFITILNKREVQITRSESSEIDFYDLIENEEGVFLKTNEIEIVATKKELPIKILIGDCEQGIVIPLTRT